MKKRPSLLAVAIAATIAITPIAHAQSNAELKQEIDLLKKQLQMLMQKVDAAAPATAAAPGANLPAVNPQEFNRLVQKLDLVEEDTIKAGLKGLKLKGTIEVAYLDDSSAAKSGFEKSKGNGGNGAGMLEISKEIEAGLAWTLRLIPLSGSGSIVHEATVSIPFGDNGAKINAGLTPDYSGYEYAMGHQNPLITNNLLYSNAASNYLGIGMSHDFGGGLTGKWMVGQVDGYTTRKAPGIAYRGDYSMGEYSGVGFSGVHFRTNTAAPDLNADLMEIDGYFTRGDLSLQGQVSVGRVINGANATALDGSAQDGKWWGVSGFVGYKLTPRLQAIARADFVNNQANGGGVYYNHDGAYGAERTDALGTANTDTSIGTNRYALSTGLNYAVNANTQWKTELRLDRSTGYNFLDVDAGTYKKSKTTFGTALVVSF